jgi:hypothetical protein
MNFWYAWLIVIWIFQSIGFARAYFQHTDGESLAARNVAFIIHIVSLLALLNIK